MPLIVMETPVSEKSPLTGEQKAALISTFTKSASEITGIKESAFSVYLHENNTDNIGVGGITLTEFRKNHA